MRYKLKELLEVKHGFAFKGDFFSNDPTEKILVTPGNFNTDGGFNSNKFKYYSSDGEVKNEYILEPDDLVINMTDLSKNSDSLGATALIPYNKKLVFLHNQRVGKIIIKRTEIITKEFFYFFSKTREFRHYIIGTSTGTTVKHTSPSKILEYEIELPPIQVQQKISKILLDFENRINLNKVLIMKYQEVTHLLFKHWFIDFEFPNEQGQPYKSSSSKMVESELGKIPAIFEVVNIKQLIQKEKNKVKLEEISEEIKYIGLEHMPRGSIALNNWETSAKVKGTKSVFKQGDILFGKLRPYFKKVGVAPISGVCSTDILVLNSKKEIHYYFLISILSSNEFIDYATSGATGTRMPRADLDHMGQYKICLPNNDSLLEKFNGIVAPIVEQLAMLTLQNKKLTTLRDTLLPKLLSGEIELPVLEPEQV